MMYVFVCQHGLVRSRTLERLCAMGGLDCRSAGYDIDSPFPATQRLLSGVPTIVALSEEAHCHIQNLKLKHVHRLILMPVDDDHAPMSDDLIFSLENALQRHFPELRVPFWSGLNVWRSKTNQSLRQYREAS